MKYITLLLLGAICVICRPGTALAGAVNPELEAILADTPGDQMVPVLLYLSDRVDIHALNAQFDSQGASLKQRHEVVVRTLQAKAQDTQGPLADHLADLEFQGRVDNVRAFWIVNAFAFEATEQEIKQLAQRDDVEVIYFNYSIESINPVNHEAIDKGPFAAGGMMAPEIGLVAIRAPEVWDLGITGEGVLVATLDTGVDGNHPALASRWAGVADPRYAGHPEWAWFDPVTGTDFPQAFGSHGTHTMGSVCGGAPGDQIGVAPGVNWIHCAVINRVSNPQSVADAILSFEWMTDPDGNPSTFWDVPRVCSNSWGVTTDHGWPPCDETFWESLDASEAAGTVQIFSAGNEGSVGLRRPADRASTDYNTMAVASVNANISGWPISGFSSRGPTFCGPGGAEAIKPDISAPGEDVRSALPGGGYGNNSGTSMASPHINGVAALMLQACPNLTVDEVKQIIYETAFDLGSPDEDNTYGWGMVDAFEAVLLASEFCGLSPPRARDGYYETAVDTEIAIDLVATDYDGEPGGPLTYRIKTLPADGNTLTDPGNGYVIQSGDLPYDLVDNGSQVLYTPTGGYYGNDEFQFAADDGGEPPDGGEGDPATITLLVLFDPPLITTETLPHGYLNFPYGPVQMEADQGQPELVWDIIEDQYVEADTGSSGFEILGTDMNWNADDNSWNYTLPFTFPYYDGQYNSVWVTSNGFLDFSSSHYDWSNSEGELISNNRIAPMWDDIRTDCGGDGDIYIEEGTGEVTIRWNGRLYGSNCTGNIVNFSATLYEDGNIRFQYGSGNDGLSPTIGISAGDGQRYLRSMYNNARNLEDANTVEIFPPSPLPEGTSLSADGVLGGTPLEFGLFGPLIRVTDALERSAHQQFMLEILEEGQPGDVDGDGDVDMEDMLLVLAAWGPCEGCPEDFNGDGVVDFSDVLILLANWT